VSLDVFFKDDIRNTLLALNETSTDTHAQVVALCGESPSALSYRSGYGDALRAVAIAFGIAVPRSPEDGVALMPNRGAPRPIIGRIARTRRHETEGGA
jgi:hypothetical protein